MLEGDRLCDNNVCSISNICTFAVYFFYKINESNQRKKNKTGHKILDVKKEI